MAYEMELSGKTLLIRFHGSVSAAEFLDYAVDLARLEDSLETTPDRLTDIGAVDELRLNSHDIEQLRRIRQNAKVKNPIRSAIFAPHDLGFGLARMFQMLTNNPLIQIEVFRELPAAKAWLGI